MRLPVSSNITNKGLDLLSAKKILFFCTSIFGSAIHSLRQSFHQFDSEMGTTLPKREPFDGLGNHVYLEKQDNLRDIGVDIPTSQVSEHQDVEIQRLQAPLVEQGRTVGSWMSLCLLDRLLSLSFRLFCSLCDLVQYKEESDDPD